MDEEAYISSISKGKLSVAEALKEIDSVKLAFSKAERIEQKLHYHDSWLQELRNTISSLTTQDYVNLKFEEISNRLELLIKKNFEEFVSQYLYQLNEKVSHKDLESALSQKVTWLAFNNFTQQMNSVKSRVEKHIMSDFEGFKTKMKIELSKKANEKKPEEEASYEEIVQLKNRVSVLEQKYHDMFVEEGLDESEDYDSQEEMDNIMDDIDRTAHRDRADSDENPEQEEEEGLKPEVSATPTTSSSEPLKAFTSASISPDNLTNDEEKKESVENSPREMEKNNEGSHQVSLKNDVHTVQVSGASPAPVEALSKTEDLKLPPSPETTQDPPIKDPPEPHQPKSEKDPKEETKAKSIPKIVIPDQSPDDSAKTPPRAKLEMENLEPQSRPARTKGGASSRNDNQTLSRKNSMVSSRSGTNAGGGPGNMRNVNKKITSLQKELETYKQALEESKETLLSYQEELAKAYEKISQVRNECSQVEDRRQAMEQSFIKALRRNGIERKQKAKSVAVSHVNARQMAEIKEKIEEKGKKIVSVSSFVEKIAADTQVMKENQKNKINEVIQYLKFLDENRQMMSKEFAGLATVVKGLETDIKGSVDGLKGEVAALQGPIVDLISEQQRENQMLNDDIKTQQNLIYEIIETKNGNLTPASRGIRNRFDSVPNTAHDLSIKYKLVSSKHGNRRTSAKTNDNWLEGIPDGNPLVLPRIIGSSPMRNKRML
jgi:hypothetical protein